MRPGTQYSLMKRISTLVLVLMVGTPAHAGFTIGGSNEVFSSSSSTSVAPYKPRIEPITINLPLSLSNGRSKILARHAAALLEALFETQNLNPENEALLDYYGNAEDVEIIMRGIVRSDVLRLGRDDALGSAARLVKVIEEISRTDEMRIRLINESSWHDITILTSAWQDILEIQRAAGLYVAIKELSEDRKWNLPEFQADLVQWMATEFVDLRFDVETANSLSVEEEFEVRAKFGLQILESLLKVLGRDVTPLIASISKEFDTGRAYKSFIDREKKTQVRQTPVGIAASVVILVGGLMSGLEAWSSHIEPLVSGSGLAYWGAMLSTTFVSTLPGISVYLLDKHFTGRMQESRIGALIRVLDEGKPLTESFLKFERTHCSSLLDQPEGSAASRPKDKK